MKSWWKIMKIWWKIMKTLMKNYEQWWGRWKSFVGKVFVRSRINAYRALAAPSLISLSSKVSSPHPSFFCKVSVLPQCNPSLTYDISLSSKVSSHHQSYLSLAKYKSSLVLLSFWSNVTPPSYHSLAKYHSSSSIISFSCKVTPLSYHSLAK